MANPEHVEKLALGRDGFNAWRAENPSVELDLADFNGHGMNLAGYNLTGADLKRADLIRADLKQTSLALADCSHAKLSFANLHRADLRAAKLDHALFEDADLSGADAVEASFRKTRLAAADLSQMKLQSARLYGADFSYADLDGADVSSVRFDETLFYRLLIQRGFSFRKLWNRRIDLFLDTSMRFKGCRGTVHGSRRFARFMNDSAYLEEFLDTPSGRRMAFVWWIMADCGRSTLRWSFWLAAATVLYAAVFYLALGERHFQVDHLPFTFSTMLFSSIGNITTLGYANVAPKTWEASVASTCEVLMGYALMGGLISIFAQKLARRA